MVMATDAEGFHHSCRFRTASVHDGESCFQNLAAAVVGGSARTRQPRLAGVSGLILFMADLPVVMTMSWQNAAGYRNTHGTTRLILLLENAFRVS